MQKQKIKLTLPANLKYSSLVRRISEEVFNYVGFSKEWSDRLELVVDELFMNAGQYGSKKEGGMIHILFSFDSQEVIFKIEDEGGGKKIDAKQLRQVIEKNYYEATDMTKVRGRGLALISNLWTDEMIVEDSVHGGVAISFTKRISLEPPSVSPFYANSTCPVKRDVGALASGRPFRSILLQGEIDSSNIDRKIEPVLEILKSLPGGVDLKLDCEGLTYINSTFIGHLVSWLNEVKKRGGHLVLQHAGRQVREVLELVGVSEVIDFEL